MQTKHENREAVWTGLTLLALVVGFSLTAYTCESAFAERAASQTETVLATGFADQGDRWAGTWFICLRNRAGFKRIDQTTPGIAHRWRKCGSKVRITNRRTGRSTIATVIDRGPYWLVPTWCSKDARDQGGFRYASHACWRRGRAAKRIERRYGPSFGWVYANHADLTPPTRRAIGHNGLEPVDLQWQ